MTELGLVAIVTALMSAAMTYLVTGRSQVVEFYAHELANCRKTSDEYRLKLEQSETAKHQGLDTLEQAVELIKTYKEATNAKSGEQS